MKYLNFNTTTGNFRGTFILDTSIDAETVVYVNTEYWYPDGFHVIFYDGYKIIKQEYGFDGAHISFKIEDKNLNGHEITVFVAQNESFI